MSKFCFEVEDERRALFTEACLRGWVAAIQDFPRFKTIEEHDSAAVPTCDVLFLETCHVTDKIAFQSLVISAWKSVYLAASHVPENTLVQYASVIKHKPLDEALAILRPGFLSDEMRPEIGNAYAQYQEATSKRPE